MSRRNKNRNTVIIEDTMMTLEIPPLIFNLRPECYFKIFDWLPLEAIHNFSQTCSYAERIAGEYFQQNYAISQIIGLENGISVKGKFSKTNGFTRCVLLNVNRVVCIVNVLPKIETLTMNETVVFSFHWECFLKYCTNLLSLIVSMNSNCEHLWLLHRYEKLQHLELTTDKYGFVIDELRSFFDQNPNIVRFSTTATYFSCNRVAFKNAKLNELAIQIEDSYKVNLKLLATILNDFYQHSIYKRLYLHIVPKIEKKSLIYGFIQSLNALEILCISNDGEKIVLPPLENLRELRILNKVTIRVKDMKTIATQLVSLECIEFYTASSSAILPFIQRTSQLRKIIVTKLEKGTHFNGNILNLGELNAEREKLNKAQKVTIYVEEKLYLGTKGRAKRINFKFIEIKPIETLDVNHYFR